MHSSPRTDFVLTCRPPYDWASMLAFFAARAIEGVERVEGDSYSRTFELHGEQGVLTVRPGPGCSLQVCVSRRLGPAVEAELAARVARAFGVEFDPAPATAHLARDPRLAPLLAARPGLRVPGAWDPFETSVRAILGQQVSVGAAVQLAGRLVEHYGTRLAESSLGLGRVFPAAARLAAIDPGVMRMPGARARTIGNVAAASVADPALLAFGRPLESTVAALRSIRGVGDWTAHYIALRALRQLDALPASDVGLLRAFVDDAGKRPSPREFETYAERWRPWRGYAAQHLWAAG